MEFAFLSVRSLVKVLEELDSSVGSELSNELTNGIVNCVLEKCIDRAVLLWRNVLLDFALYFDDVKDLPDLWFDLFS
jgi:hypothetical protein